MFWYWACCLLGGYCVGEAGRELYRMIRGGVMREWPQGPGFSPDGGCFWSRGGKLYWEDGEITEDTIIFRGMPMTSGEDYSAWSDEKRAEVKASVAQRRADEAKEQRRNSVVRKKLYDQAVAKLTEEELWAVVETHDRQ